MNKIQVSDAITSFESKVTWHPRIAFFKPFCTKCGFREKFTTKMFVLYILWLPSIADKEPKLERLEFAQRPVAKAPNWEGKHDPSTPLRHSWWLNSDIHIESEDQTPLSCSRVSFDEIVWFLNCLQRASYVLGTRLNIPATETTTSI